MLQLEANLDEKQQELNKIVTDKYCSQIQTYKEDWSQEEKSLIKDILLSLETILSKCRKQSCTNIECLMIKFERVMLVHHSPCNEKKSK